MAEIHVGTMSTLATVAIAGINNNDIAYVWHSSWQRKMVFDATSTNATDTTNHPYAQRPSDYGAGPGCWIEDVGALENQVWNANQIITGQLQSTNWAAAAGSSYDLDLAKFRLGGSNVDAAGAAAGVFIGLDSGAYKLYVGDAANQYIKFDGTKITWKAANSELDASGNLVCTGGTIGGWTLGATSLVSTNIGLHSGANAEILLGHATTYASAKIGLKNDGSGKLADGNLSWDTAGKIGSIILTTNTDNVSGVIYKGANRFIHNFKATSTQGFNLFIGELAGNFTMAYSSLAEDASYNLGLGYNSLQNLTTGNYNVCMGKDAGLNITTGCRNTCIGPSAGAGITTGTNNTFIGRDTGLAATTGDDNTGIGFNACGAVTSGFSNTCIGPYAGRAITDGFSNTCIGLYSGWAITTGGGNGCLGLDSGQALTTGTYNACLGMRAGYLITTGHYNVFVGPYAGAYQSDGLGALQTPEQSVYIGYNSKSGSVPAGGEDVIENEIVFGYNAIGNGSNTVTLGNTSIGELHCQVALTVDSDERIKRNISPSLIGLSFINALNPITFQPKNPYDYPDEIKPSNYKDRTIKEKDKEGKEKEKLIKADPRPPDNNKIYLGLTAQQVEEVMSIQGIDLELVSTSNRGKKAITYGNLIMPLITAVQELSQKVELLEARI